jgi:ribosomal protein L7/L12
MSTATRSLITAAVAIVKMTNDDRETLLLTILESNPANVIAAMKLNGVSFGDEAKPKWNVVVDQRGPDKINLIKAFREACGAGLADAKEWSEGKTYQGLEAGVFHKDLTKPEAERHATEIINRNTRGGFTVKVIRNDAPYHYEKWVAYSG